MCSEMIMKILLSQAKLFYQQGLFSSWYLERSGDGWIIHLVFGDCSAADATIIDARRRETRVQAFSSCVHTLEDIGFVVDSLQPCCTKSDNVVS